MSAPHGYGYCEPCARLVERLADAHLYCTACGTPLLCAECDERPIAPDTYRCPDAPFSYLRSPCCEKCAEYDEPAELGDTTGGSELLEQCRRARAVSR